MIDRLWRGLRQVRQVEQPEIQVTFYGFQSLILLFSAPRTLASLSGYLLAQHLRGEFAQLSCILDLELLRIPESMGALPATESVATPTGTFMHRLLSARNKQWPRHNRPLKRSRGYSGIQMLQFEFASRSLLPGRLLCHIANGCALNIRWVDETEAVQSLLSKL
ncbi:unnamed protein product [Penicillium manginii]